MARLKAPRNTSAGRVPRSRRRTSEHPQKAAVQPRGWSDCRFWSHF